MLDFDLKPPWLGPYWEFITRIIIIILFLLRERERERGLSCFFSKDAWLQQVRALYGRQYCWQPSSLQLHVGYYHLAHAKFIITIQGPIPSLNGHAPKTHRGQGRHGRVDWTHHMYFVMDTGISIRLSKTVCFCFIFIYYFFSHYGMKILYGAWLALSHTRTC